MEEMIRRLGLCMTTLRLREPLNRRWSEVHLEGQVPFIAVPHTKTASTTYMFPSKPTAKWPDLENRSLDADWLKNGGVDGTRRRESGDQTRAIADGRSPATSATAT
jgi:hypothetical protein